MVTNRAEEVHCCPRFLYDRQVPYLESLTSPPSLVAYPCNPRVRLSPHSSRVYTLWPRHVCPEAPEVI